ncbi:uncharacterized protein F5891DRAFT_944742, partial [Suillus fuscotomentosus]
MATTLQQDSLHVQNGVSVHHSTHESQGPPQNNEFVIDRFWTSYKQAATEYDREFLERNNSDMDVILLSSGLFSGVNTAFIITMQRNPTIPLLWQLVQNTSLNTTISPFAASAANSPNTIWFQTLAYIALSLNLLAAFGAVLGKQW